MILGSQIHAFWGHDQVSSACHGTPPWWDPQASVAVDSWAYLYPFITYREDPERVEKRVPK